MNAAKPLAFFPCLLLALTSAPALAQEAHAHRHAEERAQHAHGGVHFPTSCQEEAQPAFDRAVAVLHSFGYEEARRGFREVAERDPACGMAWWGVAMTWFHQYWDQPTPVELAAGRAAAERAAELGAKTERERGYIAAIGAFYRDTDERDHLTRARAYAGRMEALAAAFPDDPEASIFHALALLATRSPGDTSYTNEKRAGEILNRLLPEHPDHPGLVHYIIHAFDYPDLAELALPAARIYAELAPDSPHALHMPSHIFTRLGLWEESIASNRAMARVAEEQVARTHPGAVAFETLHANDYLVYAYLQLGRDEEARSVVEEMARVRSFDDPNLPAAYGLVSAPARYALERRDWRAAADLRPPRAELPWQHFPFARENSYYAHAIGYGRLGDVVGAERAYAAIARLQAELAAAPPRGAYDWAGRVEATRRAAAAWVAYARGEPEEAVRLLAAAAEQEERVGKHAVTPGQLLPAREQLGDLLLELGRPAEALGAYEAALRDAPRRLNGLAGAAEAARLAGEDAKARAYERELRALCGSPACRRPAERAEPPGP